MLFLLDAVVTISRDELSVEYHDPWGKRHAKAEAGHVTITLIRHLDPHKVEPVNPDEYPFPILYADLSVELPLFQLRSERHDFDAISDRLRASAVVGEEIGE